MGCGWKRCLPGWIDIGAVENRTYRITVERNLIISVAETATIKFLEDTMKLYSWFSKLMILVMLFIPISLTYAITMQLEIHELVDESDIVVKGTVKSSQLVSDNVGTKDILNRRLGTLYSIEVERVLYGKNEIKLDICYESDIEAINWALVNLCKRKPIHIFAFQKRPLKFPDGATYYKDRSQLFFLKISDFRTSLPNTAEIVSRIRSEEGIRLRRLTKSELLEEYYFEACFGVRQSTWDLAETEQQAALPAVEKFCEAISIPDLAKRKNKLQELTNDSDGWLARSAIAALKNLQ